MKPDLVWSAALAELQLQMTQATFDTWLRDSRLVKCEGDTFVVGVKSDHAKDWLEHRLITTVKRTLCRMTGQTVEARFVVLDQEAGPPSDVSSLAGAGQPAREGAVESAGPSEDEGGMPVRARAVYGTARAAIIRPELHQDVTAYDIDNFLPVLGPERWALVKVLRRLAMDEAQRDDGTRCVQISMDELAKLVGMQDRNSVSRWLTSEPLPGQKRWRRLRAVDGRARMLAMFIPRLRYWYVHEGGKTSKKGLVLYVRMDDPLTPADAQREQKVQKLILQGEMEQGQMPLVATDGEIQPLHGTALDEIVEAIQAVEPGLTGSSVIRARFRPIVGNVVDLLDDTGSSRMYHKVLRTLYEEGRLDLFIAALQSAVDVGTEDRDANLGAVFVSEIKRLGNEDDVDVGLK
jgi:hypothetical protein